MFDREPSVRRALCPPPLLRGRARDCRECRRGWGRVSTGVGAIVDGGGGHVAGRSNRPEGDAHCTTNFISATAIPTPSSRNPSATPTSNPTFAPRRAASGASAAAAACAGEAPPSPARARSASPRCGLRRLHAACAAPLRRRDRHGRIGERRRRQLGRCASRPGAAGAACAPCRTCCIAAAKSAALAKRSSARLASARSMIWSSSGGNVRPGTRWLSGDGLSRDVELDVVHRALRLEGQLARSAPRRG